MNLKYKFFSKDEIILSKEEHDRVFEETGKGKSLIVLRGGKIVINPASISIVLETGELTDIQLEKRELTLKLPESGKGFNIDQDFYKKKHFLYYEKMSWLHKEDCVCKDWK